MCLTGVVGVSMGAMEIVSMTADDVVGVTVSTGEADGNIVEVGTTICEEEEGEGEEEGDGEGEEGEGEGKEEEGERKKDEEAGSMKDIEMDCVTVNISGDIIPEPTVMDTIGTNNSVAVATISSSKLLVMFSDWVWPRDIALATNASMTVAGRWVCRWVVMVTPLVDTVARWKDRGMSEKIEENKSLSLYNHLGSCDDNVHHMNTTTAALQAYYKKLSYIHTVCFIAYECQGGRSYVWVRTV